ncbi:AMP-binding protein [Brevundimonas pondensis]|uniref:AMP-binding protein n=1 Tax=Brevundimonas pondensis TaxID=2774189 RepID=UPI001CEC3B30|nr:AMP-binding protein [Brevundimonas pondensis]
MDRAGYDAARIAARETPDAYWGEQAKRLDWMTFPSKIKDVSFNKEDFRIRWFEDGVLNVSANCIDRHLPHRENDTAIIWEGDEPTDSEHVTFGQLHERVCRIANVLKANGVRKGDRVTIYLPMIPEAAYAMLACARIGAVHSVIFGGFSPDSIAGRIEDCGSTFVITADEGLPRRQEGPAEGQCRQGAGEGPGRRRRPFDPPHRRGRGLRRGPRPGL